MTAIADVRSIPYSRRHPQFNRESLTDVLAPHQIAYVHLRELGARPSDPSGYAAGQVQYARLAATAAFQRGLARLQHGLQRYRMALLCAEKDPITCHRTILICRALRAPALPIQHILADGRLEDHAASERRLVQLVGEAPGDHNDDHDARTRLERAYDLQGHRMAYTKESPLPGPTAPRWGRFRRTHEGVQNAHAQLRTQTTRGVQPGWPAPAVGGPTSAQLTPEQREREREARLVISAELGHGREQITMAYLGR